MTHAPMGVNMADLLSDNGMQIKTLSTEETEPICFVMTRCRWFQFKLEPHRAELKLPPRSFRGQGLNACVYDSRMDAEFILTRTIELL